MHLNLKIQVMQKCSYTDTIGKLIYKGAVAMVGASVLDGTRSVEISDLVTHDLFAKSKLWSYCDASCSNGGHHIAEKVLCIN